MAGSSYKFTMTYKVGKRQSVATHIVNVLECTTCKLPELSFTSEESVVNPSDKVTLKADIGGGVKGTYKWSCASVTDAEAGTQWTFFLLLLLHLLNIC